MATEAAVHQVADATTESQLAPDAHNVDLDRSSLNASPFDEIENKHITGVDDQINSADVSVSGGSDTEASRADGSKSKDDDKGHGRTGSSVKKPATFKAVSVNKTFLAAKANAPNGSSKVVEKPAAGSSTPPMGQAMLSASRPRLVAKTGSGTRDSSPRLSAANGKPGSAPDASVVWNKNRPAPAPEPKKFTDEELKKYGIHMANRLEEEDAQGQNKWADIDDDDDDWAPEAITWGDGTKTTFPHHEEPPAPLSDNGSVASKGRLPEKPRSPAPPVSVGSPLPKPSGLASGKGLILKSGSQDKPTLVAKPPAPPAPVKSPWATLPPVAKASPGAEPAQLARGFKDHPLKGMTPPPKEIAADDFSRSGWREGAHGNRELYNPSGRHELGSDRRGSMRMEQHPRQHPSLLQRPQQSEYPEPSGAFQTSRVSQEPPFGRRRGSSNVSSGSGSFARMNKPHEGSMQPPEHLNARRTSFAGSVDSPVSPGNLSVSAHGPPRQSGWMPRASPRAAFATPHSGPPPEPVAGPPPPVQQPMADELEYQKKLMRERIELARKRRQEEEAREEAERRERIQKKLDALGPAPEKKSDKKESTPKHDEVSQPTQIQQREDNAPSSQTTEQTQDDKSVTSNKDESPTKTSHHIESGGPPARRVSHSQEAKPADLWGAASASRQERFSSWAGSAQPVARNVWGSPNNDRGLGNGTFTTDLVRVPTDGSTPAQSGKGPAPIGPPSSSRQSSQGRPQAPAPIGSRVSRYAGAAPDLANKWVSSVSENDKKMSAARQSERTDRERQLAERGLTIEDVQPTIKETWRPVHAPGDGTRRAAGSSETQSHRPGTWRGAGEDAVRSPPNRAVAQDSVGAGGANAAAPTQDDVPPGANAGIIGVGGSNSAVLPQGGKGTSSQGRPSRFFPMRDAQSENAPPLDTNRSKSPTPPPPTMEGHPAYEGDVMRPHVSLPRPQPIVKLPPSMTSPQLPQARPQFAWANPPPFKDARAPLSPHRAPMNAGEATQETWQNRINSLLNGSRSPPTQKSIVVDASSKSALDHVTQPDSATVSLPGSSPALRSPRIQPAQSNQTALVSKPMAEECFEEQEMGSLPQIRLPHKAPEAAWQPAPAQPKGLPKRFWVQPAIMEPYYFPAEVVGGGNAMRIQFPGMTEPRIVTVPFSATRGGRGSHTRSSPRHRGSGHERRGGKRDTSSTRGEHGTSSGRGGRGSYRSRGADSWTRSTATPTSLSA